MTYLDGWPELPVLPIDRAVLLNASRLRSELGNKLPDAIHVATALAEDCDRFVTNDRRVAMPSRIKLVRWDQLD